MAIEKGGTLPAPHPACLASAAAYDAGNVSVTAETVAVIVRALCGVW